MEARLLREKSEGSKGGPGHRVTTKMHRMQQAGREVHNYISYLCVQAYPEREAAPCACLEGG